MPKWKPPPPLEAGIYCACGKRAYKSEAHAMTAVKANAYMAGRTGKKAPIRAYPCPISTAWHITSREKHDG